MKTAIVRKPISNAIVNPYVEKIDNLTDLSLINVINDYRLNSDGSLSSTKGNEGQEHIPIDTCVYQVPAISAMVILSLENGIHWNSIFEIAYFTKDVLGTLKKIEVSKGLPEPNESDSKLKSLHTEYYHIRTESLLELEGKEFDEKQKEQYRKIYVPKDYCTNINDCVYLLVSIRKANKKYLNCSCVQYPTNQPFFWEKPVATSIFDNQTIQKSKILLGTVKSIAKLGNVRSLNGSRPKYAEKTYKVDYSWEESSAEDKFSFKDDDSVCTIIKKSAVCSIQGENYTGSIMLPVYVYRRDRISNDISAFVWHSGNEDDMVKKSLLGCKEGDEEFYNKYRFLRESLSLETIYGSFASLTKLSELNAAKYIVRTLAHQPEGNRCVSIEGHLLHLIGGALYCIQEIIEQSRKNGQTILSDEDYNRVNRLFQINGSHLFYDTDIDFTGIDKDDDDRVFLEKILGLKDGSNGCQRLAALMRTVFSHVSQMGIRLDYIYCDIENINNDARSLAVHRFNTRYQYKDEFKNVKDELAHRIYGVLKEEIDNYEDSKIKESLESLGFYENGNGYVDIASVPIDDDAPGLYGISNGKSYAQRRNINVWDVVMNNYTNKLFNKYIFNPILNSLQRPIKGLSQIPKCSADSRYYSKGYLNRAERYENYLGGSIKLQGGMYSSIPLYGDHMTRGYIKPNMDNWKILPKPTLFSFFMDHINRLRVTALSSPQNHFNVFVPSWNLWAFDINKIREFRVYDDKGEIIKYDESEERNAIAYHRELLYHTFLMNPDKAIAYFSLDSTVKDKAHYINLEAEKKEGYFKFAYDELNQILETINNRLGTSTVVPQTKTLAVETEPYVLTCAEVDNKWIWRLTVNEEIKPVNTGNSVIKFNIGGRILTFHNVKEYSKGEGIGFWIVTPIGEKPQIISENDYYFKNPALSINDKSLIEGNGVLALVDSKKEGDTIIPTDYVRLTFPYTQYTIFGELPIHHTISMRFCIKEKLKAVCNLLQLSALKTEGKMLLFTLKPDSDPKITTTCPELLNARIKKQPKFNIELNDICELKISFDINPNDVKVEDGKSLFSGIVAYSLINETKNSKGKTVDNYAWTSGNIEWKFNSEKNHYLVQELILWEYKARYGMLFNKETEKKVLFEDIIKKELNGIPEKDKDKKRKEIQKEKYRELLEQTPIRIESFSIFTHGHQEKVEMFRESNGLNISRVDNNKKSFTDRIITKFSWLNAEQRPVIYKLTFTLKGGNTEIPLSTIVRPSSNIDKRLIYSKDGQLTIHRASDKQIVLEVAPNSEGYMLFQNTKEPKKITEAICECDEIEVESVNPDAVYHK